MDRISGLSDELLIKILSFLPTKIAVSTSILSKQWEFLWMWLPKLEYLSISYSESECERLRSFLDINMPLHRASVLESFCLDFCSAQFKHEDIKLWILSAVSLSVRELEILCANTSLGTCKLNILPSSLYTCKSLVTLKLCGKILVDVPRSMVCLSSLKDLRLLNVTYLNGDSLQRLLSKCPVLEDLLVKVDPLFANSMRNLIVNVPSLRRLTLHLPSNVDECVINTPSLKYLKLQYYNDKSHHCLIPKMPELREAYIDVWFTYFERLIGSITSVKHLSLCIALNSLEDDVFGAGFVFNQLEHLKLCMCDEYVLTVLVWLLKDSPKLQVLELFGMEDHHRDAVLFWNQPSTVPECLLSSLQTFKFSGYLGRPEERDLATYILQNGRHLKTATIVSHSYLSESCSVPKLEMIKELALSPRASTACQLVFV